MELNAISLDTLSTIRIEGKLLKEYTTDEIMEWGLRVGISKEDIKVHQDTIIELNKV